MTDRHSSCNLLYLLLVFHEIWKVTEQMCNVWACPLLHIRLDQESSEDCVPVVWAKIDLHTFSQKQQKHGHHHGSFV